MNDYLVMIGDRVANVSTEHVKAVCRPGCGQESCSYLTMHNGWTCAKGEGFEGIRVLLERRRTENSIRAMGDNCSGPPAFAVQK